MAKQFQLSQEASVTMISFTQSSTEKGQIPYPASYRLPTHGQTRKKQITATKEMNAEKSLQDAKTVQLDAEKIATIDITTAGTLTTEEQRTSEWGSAEVARKTTASTMSKISTQRETTPSNTSSSWISLARYTKGRDILYGTVTE